MTRAEVMALSGRELDEAVFEHVLGWQKDRTCELFTIWKDAAGCYYTDRDRHPSTDLTQAAEVAEKVGFWGQWCGTLWYDQGTGLWHADGANNQRSPRAVVAVNATEPATVLARAALLCAGEAQ